MLERHTLAEGGVRAMGLLLESLAVVTLDTSEKRAAFEQIVRDELSAMEAGEFSDEVVLGCKQVAEAFLDSLS